MNMLMNPVQINEEITPPPWAVAPRIGQYECIPANDSERIGLERIGHLRFRALSVGTSTGQVAIIPMDESNAANAALIAAAPQLYFCLIAARLLLSDLCGYDATGEAAALLVPIDAALMSVLNAR